MAYRFCSPNLRSAVVPQWESVYPDAHDANYYGANISAAAVPIASRGKADAGGWRRNVGPFEPQPGRCLEGS